MPPDFIPLFQDQSPATDGDVVLLWHSEAASVEQAEDILTGEEAARVSRLRDDTERRRLAGHLCSRKQLLCRLLDADPAGMTIKYDEEGRPYLPQWSDIRISFADSNGWSVLAFSRSGPVGVDLELLRPLSWEPMLSMICDPDEAQEIRNAAADTAAPANFFRCWTAKEAVLKAEGRGMRGDARRIRLPAGYIRGETNSASLTKDGGAYQLDVSEIRHMIVTRARSF